MKKSRLLAGLFHLINCLFIHLSGVYDETYRFTFYIIFTVKQLNYAKKNNPICLAARMRQLYR